MTGKFFVVGVGPGDPGLMTLKALDVLKQSPVWLAPKGRENGGSVALSIIERLVSREGKEVLDVHFPMKKVRKGLGDKDMVMAWREAANAISARLLQGKDVAFPTMGDPGIYSTGFYVCETLMDLMPDFNVTIIPGVSSISAGAASATIPLCLGDEQMVVIPATFEDIRIRDALLTFDTIVLMKVHNVMDKITAILDELGLTKRAVLIERSSLEDERVIRDIKSSSIGPLHYFSTIIVRKATGTGVRR
ncbi:MAG: precorrin-2 C(20)-methyltransferase [Dissulfurimicrobium sp.]|uniref:precorrin-2 C(20)-methyltransferase n=1 Tax=Dissulfurimicrobium TaxID=1769732 RepID=UPI001EDA5765|nr:precorrin-2 C(20)-methyltransferase [Dissulfurimicrobium hydrothermale]UKL13063.1 precorrin-2 C(20)-methyltransferase [Dissulfurimicrobium hydrothermale]